MERRSDGHVGHRGELKPADPRECHAALRRALRAARRNAGLTLVEVQELTAGEFKTASVSAYEQGDRAVTVWRAAGLARLYGTSIDALVAEAGAGGHVNGTDIDGA